MKGKFLLVSIVLGMVYLALKFRSAADKEHERVMDFASHTPYRNWHG